MGGAPAPKTCLGKSQISIPDHRDGTGAIPNFGEVDRFPPVCPTRDRADAMTQSDVTARNEAVPHHVRRLLHPGTNRPRFAMK